MPRITMRTFTERLGCFVICALVFLSLCYVAALAEWRLLRSASFERSWAPLWSLGEAWYPQRWSSVLRVLPSIPLTLLVPLWVALYVYHRLAFPRTWSDGLTHCGHCGAVLKNLKEPRCPACDSPF